MTNIIIVGVDSSDTAAQAANVAAELARDTGATLHVVCAYAKENVTEVSDGTDHWHLTASDAAQGTADRVAGPLSAIAPRVTTAAVEGRPVEALSGEAERLSADLVVVGNKRVQGLARVLGSVASGVARHAPCDVYIAHTN